ncbi:MAG TPA: hypothetical protein VKV74_07035 [Bryobacteraceae bacterium]|nr:hypothetical protein [Bryobacteraceae bacterium]
MSDYEHPIEPHDPSEGFDRTEPNTGAIWAFAIGSVIILVVVIGALQQYFEKIWNQAVYEKVLTAPSEVRKEVTNRDDWDLTHYMYLNKDKGQVRIPLEQAQKLFMQEIAAGKPFYPGKTTVPKKEEPDTSAPAAPEAQKQ